MPDRRRLKRKLIESEVSVEPGTLGFYVQRHLRALEVRNYSPSTVRDREKTLRYFLVWAEERAITKPAEVTVAVLERYQRFMYYASDDRGKRLSFRSQSHRLMALRVFFRWLVRERVIEMSPAELIELPRPEYRLPKDILTTAQVESILSACDATTDPGLRDRAIIELLYSSGLRRFEETGDHALVAALSLPLFSGRRAEGYVAEAEANRARVDAQRRAAEVRAQATLYELHRQLTRAVAEAGTLADDIRPRAAEALQETEYAYTRGRYTLTMTGPDSGKPETSTGHYLTVWQKQADGSWKAVEDFITPGQGLPVSEGAQPIM